MPINALALPVGGRQIGQLFGAASGRSDRVTCVELSSDQCSRPNPRDDPVMNQTLRYCQYLSISDFQATSDPAFDGSMFDVSGVMSMGRSSSLPLWNVAPARTRATRWGALTARQRACAASISL